MWIVNNFHTFLGCHVMYVYISTERSSRVSADSEHKLLRRFLEICTQQGIKYGYKCLLATVLIAPHCDLSTVLIKYLS